MPNLGEVILAHEKLIADLEAKVVAEKQFVSELRSVSNRDTGIRCTKGDIHYGSLVSEIIEILQKAGGPMRVREITGAVELTGRRTKCQDGVYGCVASSLSKRKDLFMRTGAGQWELINRETRTEDTQT